MVDQIREPTAEQGPDVVPPPRADRRVLAGFGVAVFGLYTTFSWIRHATFQTTGYDLGIFDQAVWAYSRFRAPIAPLKGPGYNLLGDHFHPILVLLAPLYWIWADPRMLLAAQSALFAASIWPVTRFAELRLGARAAVWIAVAYGLSWPLQRAVYFDFHEIAFAVPLIAWVIDALDRRADRVTVACCLALLCVREDMGAFVVLVGFLVAVREGVRGGRARRGSLVLGGGLVALGFVGYWLATAVVIPSLAPDAQFAYWTFSRLGPDLPSAARFALTQPWAVVQLAVTPWVKARTLIMLALPTLFVGLGSRYLLLAMPFLAERMLNSRAELWETGFHYSSVVAPIVMMAALDSVHRWSRGWTGGRIRFGFTDMWVLWCVGCVLVATGFRSVDYPVTEMVFPEAVWRGAARVAAIKTTLRSIPPDECVEAANQLSPHLTSRDYVTQVTQSRGLATWAVIDLSQSDTGWRIPRPQEALALSIAAGFHEVSRVHDIVLLHRSRPVDPVCLVAR